MMKQEVVVIFVYDGEDPRRKCEEIVVRPKRDWFTVTDQTFDLLDNLEPLGVADSTEMNNRKPLLSISHTQGQPVEAVKLVALGLLGQYFKVSSYRFITYEAWLTEIGRGK